jgi:hypothetical protein
MLNKQKAPAKAKVPAKAVSRRNVVAVVEGVVAQGVASRKSATRIINLPQRFK